MSGEYPQNNSFQEFKEGFYQHLQKMGYGAKSLYDYKYALNELERHMIKDERTVYTKDFSVEFMDEVISSSCYSARAIKTIKRALRRFNNFIESKEDKCYPAVNGITCPIHFEDDFEQYLKVLRLRGLSERTVKAQSYTLLLILSQPKIPGKLYIGIVIYIKIIKYCTLSF